jgi:general stress protein 26
VKKTTAERDPGAARKLRDLVKDISVAMITTVTPDGALRSRPMATQAVDEDGLLWFFAAEDSGKARDLAEEHAVNVSYADPARNRYVSVSGNASVVHDSDKIHELWKSSLEAFFPRGLDDPQLALLCVRIETAEYWDASAGNMVSVASEEADGANSPATEHTRVDIRATPSSG